MCLEAPILSSFDSNNTCRAPTECQGHLFANPQALRQQEKTARKTNQDGFFAVIGTHDAYQPKEGVVFKQPPIWSLITCPGFSGFARTPGIHSPSQQLAIPFLEWRISFYGYSCPLCLSSFPEYGPPRPCQSAPGL
ncbi:unnamed protein product [Urochloa humidicola]